MHHVAVRLLRLGLGAAEADDPLALAQLITVNVDVVQLTVVRVDQLVVLEVEVHLRGTKKRPNGVAKNSDQKPYNE